MTTYEGSTGDGFITKTETVASGSPASLETP
jgi:hypothetical protein